MNLLEVIVKFIMVWVMVVTVGIIIFYLRLVW